SSGASSWRVSRSWTRASTTSWSPAGISSSTEHSSQPIEPSSTGAPPGEGCQGTPPNLSVPLVAKRALSSRWFSPRMFTQNRSADRTSGQLLLERATQNSTSGGVRDTDVKELTASPAGAPSLPRSAVTATTPVVNRPATVRSRRGSTGAVEDIGVTTVEDMPPGSAGVRSPTSAQGTYWLRQQNGTAMCPGRGISAGHRTHGGGSGRGGGVGSTGTGAGAGLWGRGRGRGGGNGRRGGGGRGRGGAGTGGAGAGAGLGGRGRDRGYGGRCGAVGAGTGPRERQREPARGHASGSGDAAAGSGNGSGRGRGAV